MRGVETLNALIRAAQEAWDDLADRILNRLSDTGVHRVRAVLDAESWYTKYINVFKF